MVNISSLGEFSLINRFSKSFLKDLPAGVVGIGDDCAVIPQSKDSSLLVTTDLLIEDVHFLRKAISPEDLGYKSLTVNLSDIAAMGGTPRFAFLSIALHKDTEVKWVDRFFDGFKKACEKFNVHLLGGDTTRTIKSIAINVAVMGEASPSKIKFRSSAKSGDVICVTGFLGDSAAGLKSILENNPSDRDRDALIQVHHRPEPHLREGQWLAEQGEVHAMMDVSDGIHSDLKRIMNQSQCGAHVDLENLPLSETVLNVSKKLKWNAIELAAVGGEDYCLLCTIPEKDFSLINKKYLNHFSKPLYPIGKITSQIGALEYSWNGKPYTLSTQSFEHFSTE